VRQKSQKEGEKAEKAPLAAAKGVIERSRLRTLASVFCDQSFRLRLINISFSTFQTLTSTPAAANTR
jgi:hypothetical protein